MWASRTYSVPTADFRGGNFNRMLGAPILNAAGQPHSGSDHGRRDDAAQGRDDLRSPSPGNGDGTGRSVFSSGGQVNAIPQNRLNAPMLKLLALVPLPNLDGDTDNYFSTATQPLNRNNVDAKVNWNRNERQQIWFKYSAMNALVHWRFGLGDAGGECICGGGVGHGPHARADRGHGHDLHGLAELPD